MTENVLHRMTLRVLPRLTIAVTSDEVRRRKRWAMFVAGFVAFTLYRLAKRMWPLADPMMLLAVSGAICTLSAVVVYRLGRGADWRTILARDGLSRVAWVGGWIGFVYGIQLSLLVLALLKFVAQYDFLEHPEGPGMMAIIIACTSVVRDAFEIGHVRRLQADGTPVLTFPDGAPLRAMVGQKGRQLLPWVAGAALVPAVVAMVSAGLGEWGQATLTQLGLVGLVAGTLAVPAYLAGEQRSSSWTVSAAMIGWGELFRFWWWPGLAFAATYYLAVAGLLTFVIMPSQQPVILHGLVAALVGLLMVIDGYYLGYRRHVEDQVERTVPASLLRCPFVMGLLSGGGSGHPMAAKPAELMVGEAGRHG